MPTEVGQWGESPLAGDALSAAASRIEETAAAEQEDQYDDQKNHIHAHCLLLDEPSASYRRSDFTMTAGPGAVDTV